ncbi:MAG: hypothetical protein A2020_14890 [Lentisphaerae bacterium GWF2_45_14]|nr:MAG: hypothetical protein A2020_14890 [Lentisphaerae bacterium GWF2_45_14]
MEDILFSRAVFENALYFLALLNPASKIFLLASQKPAFTKKEIWRISVKSSIVALIMLLIFSVIGQFLLEHVFRVQIYSLKVAGGIVLFIIGLTAVRKGVFFQKDQQEHQGQVGPEDDISIVPLAAPLIAGPGTITAVISFAATVGFFQTALALSIAILGNFLFMVASAQIGKILEKFYATGPLIRITGLIVAAVSVQMILDGAREWLRSINFT